MSNGLLYGSQVRTRAPAGSCWDPDKGWNIEQVWIQQYGRGWLRGWRTSQERDRSQSEWDTRSKGSLGTGA